MNIGYVTSDCLCEMLKETQKMNIGIVRPDAKCERHCSSKCAARREMRTVLKYKIR